MNCPICGSTVISFNNQPYCPSCKIFLGNIIQNPSQLNQTEPSMGDLYRKSDRASFRRNILFSFVFLVTMGGLIWFLILNFTSYGYREKIFYRYNYTEQASSYLRNKTSIDILFPEETKPFGIQHSGYWSVSAGTNNVHLNTANDEVAIHEFAHAWYDKLTRVDGNLSLKKNLIEDTNKLANLSDPEYYQTSKKARWIVENFCFCSGGQNGDYTKIDDQHYYAYMAEFVMGKFKTGPRKLPNFMWKYFGSMFNGSPRVSLCYEKGSCDFSWDNDFD